MIVSSTSQIGLPHLESSQGLLREFTERRVHREESSQRGEFSESDAGVPKNGGPEAFSPVFDAGVPKIEGPASLCELVIEFQDICRHLHMITP